jgi:glycosyltransferase involved in cell wall biosynthesis
LHLVLPGDVDDRAVPSGGNVYDRRLSQSLAAAGRPVREIAVPGGWPRPDSAAREELARSLAAVPDGSVVLLDGLVACGVPDVVVPQAGRLRLAVLVHLPLADETGLPAGLAAELDALERQTLHAVRMVVATSPWAARSLAEHHGLPANRVRVVTPGTDPAPLAPGTDGSTRLLCVASVTPRKGQDLLVQALAAVADLPWTCVLAGPLSRDPEYVARLRDLIAEHGLGDRVELAGTLTGEPLAAAYSAADLAVLPSRAETYGMVVTEALMRGIPVLAAGVGGVPDALGHAPDGSLPGILVPPDDHTALVAAVRQWLDDDALRHRLRTSARDRRDTLPGWERTSRRMDTLLEPLREEAS